MPKKKVYPFGLIGETIEIISAKNQSNFGIKGKIVDETKMTLKIKALNKIKVLLKTEITLKLTKNNQIIVGKTILKRPEERLKG